MAPPELSRALHRLIKDRDTALRFRDGDLDPAITAELSDDERSALVECDLPALYALGAHPMLLFHLSAILFPRAHYITNVVPAIQGVANPYYDYYATRRPSPETVDG